MECSKRKWAEPGTKVTAGVIVSCAAWGRGELGLSAFSLEAEWDTLGAAQPRVLQGALAGAAREASVSEMT